MIQITKFPSRTEFDDLLRRPVVDSIILEKHVKKIIEQVIKKKDRAVRKYTNEFDGVRLRKLEVSEKEIKEAQKLVSDELKSAINLAKNNIQAFHARQVQETEVIETMPGVQCWRKAVGIERVGLYIPGGSAPLFSTVLMLGIPAQLAGCKEIVLCSPPDKQGKLHPAILYAARLVGVTQIFKVGGAQAIAAMACGTESIPIVFKIFGPGNQYVTVAKQLVQKYFTAIDMPAGPSEVAVFADKTADPVFVAADLLSQAEHGADSQVLLVTTSQNLLEEIIWQMSVQLKKLPRKEIAEKALQNSRAILFGHEDDAIELLNAYAPEHLILSCANADTIVEKITNAGSVFLGHYSPESAGDYASGTNHTLPTNGYARMYSGVSVDSFVKKITFQKLSEQGLRNIGNAVIEMAETEGLSAHAESVRVRIRKLDSQSKQ